MTVNSPTGGGLANKYIKTKIRLTVFADEEPHHKCVNGGKTCINTIHKSVLTGRCNKQGVRTDHRHCCHTWLLVLTPATKNEHGCCRIQKPSRCTLLLRGCNKLYVRLLTLHRTKARRIPFFTTTAMPFGDPQRQFAKVGRETIELPMLGGRYWMVVKIFDVRKWIDAYLPAPRKSQ